MLFYSNLWDLIRHLGLAIGDVRPVRWFSWTLVSYCFARSSIKFQCRTALKIVKFDPNWAFPDCNSSLNSQMTEMMHKAWSNIEEVPYCFSRASVKFQGHTGQKIANFDPNWAFLDCNFTFNSPMHLKWCTKLDVVWKRCPVVFQGHPSNFKVTRDKKSPISTRIERFRSVTSVWIHRWIWNDTQGLM